MRAEHQDLPKLIVLLGPTACGKTDWGLRLAKKINGEIISADSRQIYKKMDIGTAKVMGEWRRNGLRRTYFVGDVPHHLIDFLDPGKAFSVAEFRDRAIKYAKMAVHTGRVPMVVGGTGLYISALVDNLYIPRVPPNAKLRKSLDEKKLSELVRLLEQLDPAAAEVIDRQNKRRVIRALEVCIFSGEPFSAQRKKGGQLFDVLEIGIDVPREVLYERIRARVDGMAERGLVREIENLLKQKYSWRLPSMNGIGYRQFRCYFEKTCALEQAIELLKRDTRRYARRQLSWFRRDKRIVWVKEFGEAEKLVAEFLRQ
ncbi:MAG: tRNA (adenosine(37)-N6)-dimethylallyltransferase MiaA [Candidatus Magasanikbacteria bacterium RIFCSPHIGHO2_02_FULL_51_14]|uniref:tRNA dimethylallyltransferase n=1 Tax=Candidatus Magasanikbacteria bacterium RIFCSPHIGHO2_02_FULL_51_14 TaxID=1798683 RepID=A0A1F6MQK2_9BACT|nr:MAG: tRNA (adenosine(37)-N6)-dimethylallyltransferase MiaA [Candidatus Magasanikbacteria bacterium RIFCSPHIGHO2_02_FULL_51_14]